MIVEGFKEYNEYILERVIWLCYNIVEMQKEDKLGEEGIQLRESE